MDKRIDTLPKNIRSKCCLGRISVWELTRNDGSGEPPFEPDYEVNELFCDECGEGLEWGEMPDEGKQMPAEFYDLTSNRNIERIALEIRQLRAQNNKLDDVVYPLREVMKALAALEGEDG